MDINVIYNMELKVLKKYLMDNIDNPDIILLLNDSRIKKKILWADSNEFFKFFSGDIPFKILSVLLEYGGAYFLVGARSFKIPFIIKKYYNESNLFKNKDFCELVCIEAIYNSSLLSDICVEAAIPLVEYALEHDDYIESIFLGIESIQLEIIKRIEIPYDELFHVISVGSKETTQYLLNNDERVNSLIGFSFDNLFKLATKGIVFPKHLLYEDKFVSWITSMKNIKKYRILMNLLSKNHDISFIEDVRKKYYEEQISNYDEKMDMLADYSECYGLLTSKNFKKIKEISKILVNYLCYGDDNKHNKHLLYEIIYCALHKKHKKLRRLLRDESHFQLTNMIIDYYFEDIAHNVFLDIRELINFNSKVMVITESEVLRYNNILNLDNLSYQEAKELFEELKNYHYSQFYDHMRSAKDKAIDLMEQVILNEETIQKYRDKTLSEQHGVDVYILDGDEYYALIKSLGTYKDSILEEDIIYYSDGSSYTLDSSMKRATYYNPKRAYNLIYSTIPKNQIVHMFSVDSFSKYIRGLNETATSRVYEIRTPEELVKASSHYNEIVMAVPNSSKSDEINVNLQAPKVLGIYCFDKILKEDVASAKNLKIGIVLVKTDKYNQDFEIIDEEMSEAYRVLAGGGGEESDKFDYVRNVYSDDMAYRKRFHLNKN